MLEDKLRELRLLALDPREYDDRTVTLSQLDSLRRELLGTARNSLRQVDFGKVQLLFHPSINQTSVTSTKCRNCSMHADAAGPTKRAVAVHATAARMTTNCCCLTIPYFICVLPVMQYCACQAYD